MKKIFMLVFLAIHMFFVNIKIVNASNNEEVEKNLVCNVGFSQIEMLEYEGYTIQSSNVNFYKCGTYQIVYTNNITNQEVVKNVTVKTNDQLVNGVNFEITKNLYFEANDSIYFTKILNSNDGGYIVSYNERLTDEQDEKYNIKLMKIVGREVVFDITLFSNAKGQISDFIIDDNKIIMFVEKENAMSRLDVYLYVYSVDGTLLESRKYTGSSVDHAVKVISDNMYYYLVGETTSDDDDFRFQHTRKAGFVFCIDKTTLKDVELYDATTSYDMSIIDAITSNGYLYVVANYYDTVEKAKHTVVYMYHTSKRILINVVGLSINKKTESVLKLTKDEKDNLYMATSDYDYNTNSYINHIYSLGITCARKLLFDVNYEKVATANLVSFVATSTNQIILLYSLVDSEQENQYGYLYRVYQDSEILFDVESFSSNEQVNGLLENDTLEIYKSSHSTLSCDQMSYAKLTYDFNQTIYELSQRITQPSLFIDGVLAKLNLEKSIIPSYPSIYGSYPVKYIFNSPHTDVIFQDNVYFMPYTSLKNNEIYDVNTMIFFNGKATLNNYQIENGYLITTPGDYTLEVVGVNDEVYKVFFTIKNLSQSEEKYLPIIPKIRPITNELPVANKQVCFTSLINEETIVPKKKNNLWYLLIPITLFVGFGIVVRKRG